MDGTNVWEKTIGSGHFVDNASTDVVRLPVHETVVHDNHCV